MPQIDLKKTLGLACVLSELSGNLHLVMMILNLYRIYKYEIEITHDDFDMLHVFCTNICCYITIT